MQLLLTVFFWKRFCKFWTRLTFRTRWLCPVCHGCFHTKVTQTRRLSSNIFECPVVTGRALLGSLDQLRQQLREQLEALTPEVVASITGRQAILDALSVDGI